MAGRGPWDFRVVLHTSNPTSIASNRTKIWLKMVGSAKPVPKWSFKIINHFFKSFLVKYQPDSFAKKLGVYSANHKALLLSNQRSQVHRWEHECTLRDAPTGLGPQVPLWAFVNGLHLHQYFSNQRNKWFYFLFPRAETGKWFYSLVYCGGILGHYTFDFLTPEVSPEGCNSGARDGKNAFFRGSEPHYVTYYFFKLRKAVESPRNSFLSIKYDNWNQVK